VRSYGQFCPVAKAAEILAERWTPLIVRELLTGSHHFNEIEQGVPRIPRSVLVQRLRSLERAGLVERRDRAYYLLPAGLELFDVIDRMGAWGQRWLNREIHAGDLDPDLLMWDVHRRLNWDCLPERRVVVQFDLRGARPKSYWLVLDAGESSICFTDPGFEIDLLVTADTLALHRVWMGRLALRAALDRDLIQIEGPRGLVRAFPSWLALNYFAGIPPAPHAA
jgi:DNA-binding HxlR family transcriptional regulator